MMFALPFEVTDVSYVEHEDAADVTYEAMRFDVGDTYSTYVPNSDFDTDNVALCVLAYCGGRPSDLEAAEGASLPLTVDEYGEWAVPDTVVARGRDALDAAAWGPSVETE